MDYQQHLQSDYWKKVSKEVKKRAGYKCQTCNSGLNLEAHHRTYDFIGREMEHLDEMVCLCKRCHSLFHGMPVMESEKVQVIDTQATHSPKTFQYIKISRAVLHDDNLSPNQKILLSYMLGFQDFFASDSHIAKILRMNKRTVEGDIVALRRKGYILGKRNTRKPCFPPIKK